MLSIISNLDHTSSGVAREHPATDTPTENVIESLFDSAPPHAVNVSKPENVCRDDPLRILTPIFVSKPPCSVW